MKAERQNEILKIIRAADVETQDQLLSLLKKAGFQSTQATISRDIKELHLIKEPTGLGTYRYSIAPQKHASNLSERLQKIFRESVVSYETAQNLIVLKTMPGLASAACSALDRMDIPEMVGTLAGDDTAILIMKTNQSANSFCGEINLMIEG